MALPDLISKATEPAGTGIYCSEHSYSSPPNSGLAICPQCELVALCAVDHCSKFKAEDSRYCEQHRPIIVVDLTLDEDKE